MKCDFCKKRLVHPKIVHSATGAFHAECLDKVHAASEAVGEFMFTLYASTQAGHPEDKISKIADALQKGARPMSVFLKQLAQNLRDQESKGKIKK